MRQGFHVGRDWCGNRSGIAEYVTDGHVLLVASAIKNRALLAKLSRVQADAVVANEKSVTTLIRRMCRLPSILRPGVPDVVCPNPANHQQFIAVWEKTAFNAALVNLARAATGFSAIRISGPLSCARLYRSGKFVGLIMPMGMPYWWDPRGAAPADGERA